MPSTTFNTWDLTANGCCPPTKGIGVGETTTFTFYLTGNAANLDDPGDIMVLRESSCQGGPLAWGCVKLQGGSSGSTMALAGAENASATAAVPEPATLVMVGTALTALAVVVARQRRQ